MTTQSSFQFKEGSDVFTPKDLVELARPGTGVANHAGDLVLVPVSKYSFEDKENHKTIYIAPLESTVKPFELPLAKGGEAFWLTGNTIAHEKTRHLISIDVVYHPVTENSAGILHTDSPVLLGSFPTSSATNFRYSTDGFLVFSDSVYADGNLTTVKEQDEAWENRGTSALVYDHTYERHWDHWVLPKSQALFSVRLTQGPDHKWSFGSEFVNLLAGTSHSSPVEPFGGTDDFDVSKQTVIYTTLDPALSPAWHTKQNVYIVDVAGGSKPRELTSSALKGQTHSPILNENADKAAWLELDKDGYESDRAKIIIYDLKKDVRFTLTQKWDRSPDSLAFSKEGEYIYFTAGDHAKVKVFVLPIPATPQKSTTDPDLSPKYLTPVPIVKDGASSGLQTLYNGRVLISKSSFTSPNDVFLVRGLDDLQMQIAQAEGAAKFTGKVEQITNLTDLGEKKLSKGEEFWFKGAEDIDMEGEKKAHPVVLLIHGGPQSAWEDQWSTRWNPNAINPTGSSTFGQAFTDAISGDWGGKPFVDLQKGWKHVLDTYPEIDTDRAVAAGASWGGYAINWIQGHPEYNFGFKALVCHDGVFHTTYTGYATEELFFFNQDWHGRPWEKEAKELAEKYNPSNFVDKWSTPQLWIHGSKDYRLPETEGIGAFHAHQQCVIPLDYGI
ncbi:alpha/beta-hydrolase [Gymnopus androsaceus JB14]|uniref:Dipeptidyl-peptidase V n=1 Tax=Gymnopus androsaceus JB14 TaxID=1447944 RepID=A0A6A4H7T7_9AGAR|nr:alpha/beta-hydrolase [Gymnopus androsaceus JB14]